MMDSPVSELQRFIRFLPRGCRTTRGSVLPPFDAVNSNALLHAISTQAAPTLAGRGVCDEALSGIIDRGLTKKRDERWQHARDLMLALADWLRSQGVLDDITGLSLRGRGINGPSSLPRALQNRTGSRAPRHSPP